MSLNSQTLPQPLKFNPHFQTLPYNLERLPKLPTRGCHVVRGNGPSVTGGDLKGEALAIHVTVTLPVLPPVM